MEGKIFIDINPATEKARITIELPNFKSERQGDVRDTLIKMFMQGADPDTHGNLSLTFPSTENTIAYIDLV